MADVNATVVESSPAAAAPVAPSVDYQQVLDTMNDQQRSRWELTGELPTTEDPATSDAPKEETSEAKPNGQAKSEPESGTGKEAKQDEPAGGKGSEAQKRIRELVAEKKELERKLAEASGSKTDVKPAEAESSPAKEAKPGDLKAPEKPKRPKLAEFDRIEDFEAAQDKYADEFEAYMDAKEEFRTKEREAKAAEQAKLSEVDKARKAQEEEWTRKVDTAVKRYPDFEKTVTEAAHLKKIGNGSLVDKAILNREHGTDLLYHFAKNPADLQRVLAMDAIDQGAELKKIELTLSKAPAPKRHSEVPNPPREVGGKNAAPADVIESAAKEGDYATYEREMNARDARSVRKG